MQATWLAFVTGKVLQKGSCMPASWLTCMLQESCAVLLLTQLLLRKLQRSKDALSLAAPHICGD
jgi:hypothetical protein